MSGWRTALRVARREARRAKGRAALVIAMIALPIAALTFGAVVYDTFELTPQERADRLMGTAQALVSWPANGPVQQHPTEPDFFFVPAPGTQSEPVGPSLERLLALLPAGTTAIEDRSGQLNVNTAAGTGNVGARMLDYANPLAAGMLRQVSGRAPAGPDEVALTPAAAARIGAGVGGTVRLADGSRTFRVVGVVEDPTDLRVSTIVLRGGALPPEALAADGQQPNPRNLRWLVATPGPMTWADVKQLNTHGVVATSRHVLANPPGEDEQYPFLMGSGGDSGLGIAVLVGGLAMLEIVLLAGPAFAVGARRRRRDLALVAAAGGTPAHVRRIVLADGVVLGAVAAVAGVALGIAAAAAGRPLLEEHAAWFRSGSFRVFPLALAVLAGLALTTGLLAALVPAWISSRQDVVAALAGRRGITRSRRRWLALGVVMVGAGAGVAAAGTLRISATIIVAGLVVAELGLVLCTPAIVGLVARVGRWLPVPPRIALRDTSRNRTAAAPAISAVMAAVIGGLAVGVVFISSIERDRADYRTLSSPGDTAVVHIGTKGGPGPRQGVPPDAVATMRTTLPVTQVHEVGTPSCPDTWCMVSARVPAARACPYSFDRLQRDPTTDEQRAARRDSRCDGVEVRHEYFGVYSSPFGLTLIVDEAALGDVAGVVPEHADEVAAALRSGAIAVDDPRYVDNGRVTLTIRSGPRPDEVREVTARGFVLPDRPRVPVALMTEQTARSLGFEPSPFVTLATTSRMPTVEEQDRLQSALGSDFAVYVERGNRGPSRAVLIVLAIVSGVITLGAAAIATGLAAADGRADLTTLAAVGASPRVRRALALSQSGVIAGLGSLLGAAAGLGASVAVLAALNRQYAGVWPAPTPYPITVPWLNVGIAVLAVPLIAMLGAGLLTRSRLPIERRL